MRPDKKLASNAVFLFLDYIFVTLLGFFYWSVAGKTLPPEQYGIVSTSINLATLLSGISLLGLNTTLWKLLPEYLEKKQLNKTKELILFSLKLITISNLIIIFSLFLLSNFFINILKISFAVMVITAINLFIFSFNTQFATILMGTQNMKKIAITDLIGKFVQIFASAALIFSGFSYFGPLIGFAFGILIITILRIPFRFLGFCLRKVLDKKQILSDYALPAFVSNLAWVIFLNGQYVLLTAIKNPEVTGIFTIAMVLTSPIVSIPNTLSSALFPLISQLSINHNSKKQRYLISLVFRYALFFSIPVSIFLILFSKNMILFFARAEYLSASFLFPILALASIVYGSGMVFNQTLYSLGKPKIQRNIILMTVGLFFIFSIPLTIYFSAFGTAFAYFLSVSFLNFTSYKNIKRLLRISLPIESMKKIFLASLFSFIYLYIVANTVPNILFALIFCFIGGLLYLELLFLLKFYTKQDIVIAKAIFEKSPIFRKKLVEILNSISKFV